MVFTRSSSERSDHQKHPPPNPEPRPNPEPNLHELVEKARQLLRSGGGFERFDCRHVEEYARFMAMKVHFNDIKMNHAQQLPRLRPCVRVDSVWHHHMCMPWSYMRFCLNLTGLPVLIDHSPETEFHPNRRALYAETLREYERSFGKPNMDFWDKPSEPVQKFQIFVRTLSQKVITLDVHREMTIREVKFALYIKEGIPPDQQRFIFGETQLEDHITLEEYDIEKDETIYFVLRLIGC